MKRFALLIISILSLLLTSCGQYTYEHAMVDGVVTNLEHEDSYIRLVPYYNYITDNLTVAPVHHQEHNYITITYGDLSETFDDKTLYNEVEIGDTVEIILRQIYDENNNLIREELELPE